MRPILIKDGLTLNYGRLEYHSYREVCGHKIAYNIFGAALLQTNYQSREEVFLRMGDGIKTFKNEAELDKFLLDLFLENIQPIKIYDIEHLHKRVK